MNELKLKYKWLITQFIRDSAEKQRVNNNNKSLQSCQNIFRKAQNKINLLQSENNFIKKENVDLYHKTKMLRVQNRVSSINF